MLQSGLEIGKTSSKIFPVVAAAAAARAEYS